MQDAEAGSSDRAPDPPQRAADTEIIVVSGSFLLIKQLSACNVAADREMATLVQGSIHPGTRCKQAQRVDTCKDDPHIAEQQALMKGDVCAGLAVLAGFGSL